MLASTYYTRWKLKSTWKNVGSLLSSDIQFCNPLIFFCLQLYDNTCSTLWKESETRSSKSHKGRTNRFSKHYSNNVSCQPMFHCLVHSPFFIPSCLSELWKHSIWNKIWRYVQAFHLKWVNHCILQADVKQDLHLRLPCKGVGLSPLSRKKAVLDLGKIGTLRNLPTKQRLP